MSKAVVIHKTGGLEALTIENREVGMPGPGELRIQNTHIGLNYIDVYFREGLYGTETPFVLGSEGAGHVTDVGEGVNGFKVGDRVAYVNNGAYAEERLIDATKVVVLPDGVSNEAAAAIMLKGMTVQYLFKQSYAIQPGQTCLFHAAAGGVGLLACQWAKAMGVTLIGTAGTAEKCQLALDHGAKHCVNYRDDDWVDQVRALSGGGCAGCLRLRRPIHSRRVAGLSQAVWLFHHLRQCIRPNHEFFACNAGISWVFIHAKTNTFRVYSFKSAT